MRFEVRDLGLRSSGFAFRSEDWEEGSEAIENKLKGWLDLIVGVFFLLGGRGAWLGVGILLGTLVKA